MMTTTESDRLRGAVRGTVLTPADDGYDDARRLNNGMIDRRPAAIVQVTGPDDIATTLAYARERGLSVSVRGGGHGVAGHALGGDVVIDLAVLRGVTVDAEARTAVVGAGATWGEVDAATQAYGLAVPGGRVTHTGVAGLTLGGGDGWLSRKYGLTSDNLLSVDLVAADGRRVTASASTEPELFWALRGGGGNFGAVTSFTFRLHPVGPLVYGGLMAYQMADAPAVLELLVDLVPQAPDEFSPAVAFMAAPPAPFVPPEMVGRPILGLIPAWMGEPAETGPVLQPLRDRVRPVVDASGPMPYTALQSMLDESNEPGLRSHWSGSFLPDLAPGLVKQLQDSVPECPSPLSQTILYPAGGAVSRLPADATAYPHREASWLVHPMARWTDPADDQANVAWVRQLGGAIRARGETGTYLNVDPEGGDERVRWAFGPSHYRRLQAVKRAWDPDDVFRHCAHIPATR
jgi:FAD/FMN-containing dehydrogenase